MPQDTDGSPSTGGEERAVLAEAGNLGMKETGQKEICVCWNRRDLVGHRDIKEAAVRDMRRLQRGRYLLDMRLEKEMRSKRRVLITACCCVSDVAPRCLPKLCGSISRDIAALEEKVMIYSQALGWAGSSSHPLDSLLPLFPTVPSPFLACVW